MISWVLIAYLSTGFGTGATGGPVSVQGFSSKQACEATGERFKKLPKFDWYACVEADVPPTPAPAK